MPQAYTVLPHEIDHIRARKHHGPTTLQNTSESQRKAAYDCIRFSGVAKVRPPSALAGGVILCAVCRRSAQNDRFAAGIDQRPCDDRAGEARTDWRRACFRSEDDVALGRPEKA
jgi:hypothetical protein